VFSFNDFVDGVEHIHVTAVSDWAAGIRRLAAITPTHSRGTVLC
jgi:hypothetical protein